MDLPEYSGAAPFGGNGKKITKVMIIFTIIMIVSVLILIILYVSENIFVNSFAICIGSVMFAWIIIMIAEYQRTK